MSGRMRLMKIGKRAGGGPLFKMPVDFVTQTAAILARRGAGKTYTGQVMAEGLLEAGQQVVVIDPLDAWWGLRSSANGKGAGYPIVIFGGPNGDMPLVEGMAKEIANLVAENPDLSCVISIVDLSKTKQRQFVADFATQFFYRKRAKGLGTAVHLFVDEADMFAPQRVFKGGERMLGAMEDLFRRGRRFGIGGTVITQRPASLHKDVLTQAELLVTGQVTGPHDKKAIKSWIEDNATIEQQRGFMSSLAELPVGVMWFWSPAWLKTLEKVAVRRKTTFDSSATPKAGRKKIRGPKKRAKIDLDAIRSNLKDAVKLADENDPKILKRKVAQLQRELAAKPKLLKAPKQEEHPQVKWPSKAVLREFATMEVQKRDVQWQRAFSGYTRMLRKTAVLNLIEKLDNASLQLPAANIGTPKSNGPVVRPKLIKPERPRPAPPRAQGTTIEIEMPATWPIKKCERAILTVLAQRQRPCTKKLVALQSGYSVKSGGFNNSLSKLRNWNYITRGAALEITSEGLTALGSFDPMPVGEELLDYWQGKLPLAQSKIVQTLRGWHEGLEKSALADQTGYSATSGGFNNAICNLRSLELVVGRGQEPLKLSDELFG